MFDPARHLFPHVAKKPGKMHKYLGHIVMVDDPHKLQRVKIRCGQLHKGVSDEQLPWCSPSQHEGSGQMSTESSGQKIPQVGSEVIVNFDGDVHFPYYTLGPVSKNTKAPEEFTGDNYKNMQGHVTPAGSLTSVDHKDDIHTFTHNTGAGHQWDKNGGFTSTSVSNMSHNSHGEYEALSKGKMKMSSHQDIEIDGSKIYINTKGTKSPKEYTPRKKPSNSSSMPFAK